MALLLKGAPCLDQQAPGASRRLLEALSARHVALSYPNRSLGGAGKGMVAHYRAHLDGMLAGTGWELLAVPGGYFQLAGYAAFSGAPDV